MGKSIESIKSRLGVIDNQCTYEFMNNVSYIALYPRVSKMMLLLATVWSDSVVPLSAEKGLDSFTPNLYPQLIQTGPKTKFNPKTFVALELIRTYAQDDGSSADNQFALQMLRREINRHVKHSLMNALDKSDSISFLKRSLQYIRGRLLIDRPAPKTKSEFNIARNKLNENSRRPKVTVKNEKNATLIKKVQEEKLADFEKYTKAMEGPPEKQKEYILGYVSDKLKTMSMYNQKVLIALVVCGNITPYNNYGKGRENKVNWLNKAGPKKLAAVILTGVRGDSEKWVAKDGERDIQLTLKDVENRLYDGTLGIIRGNAIYRTDLEPEAPFKMEEITEVGRKKLKLSVGKATLENKMREIAQAENSDLLAKISRLLEAD